MMRVLVRAAVAVLLLAPPVLGRPIPSSGGVSVHVLGLSVMETAQRVAVPPPGNLVYHHGPVMHTSHTYTIFWKPAGAYMSPGYEALINRYFQDVGGSALYGITTQYPDAAGPMQNVSQFGGTWDDPHPYPVTNPPHVLNMLQVVGEIARAIVANHWPTQVTDMYFLYLARGEGACFTLNGQNFGCFMGLPNNPRAWCGAHAAVDLQLMPQQPIITINGALLGYAGTNLQRCGPTSVGAPAGPNNNPDADAEISVTSHEHLEGVTDPFPFNLSQVPHHVSPLPGWYVQFPFDGEIADKCAWRFGNPAANGSNIVMHGNSYLVQEEWSNAALNGQGACVL